MIHQLYYHPEQAPYLFETELYRPLGIEPAVNPELTRNCPELRSPKNRFHLCEYGGLLHVWRNPPFWENEPWVGFTSFRAQEKFCLRIFWPSWKAALTGLLGHYGAVVWGMLTFPHTLAEDLANSPPGAWWVYLDMFKAAGRSLSRRLSDEHTAPYANYWLLKTPDFLRYMEWSWPLVQWCLKRIADGDKWFNDSLLALGQIQERLFILWCLEEGITLYDATLRGYGKAHWLNEEKT